MQSQALQPAEAPAEAVSSVDSASRTPTAHHEADHLAAASLRNDVHQQCQLAGAEASDGAAEEAAPDGVEGAAGKCGPDCSDYRFVYLGCQVMIFSHLWSSTDP